MPPSGAIDRDQRRAEALRELSDEVARHERQVRVGHGLGKIGSERDLDEPFPPLEGVRVTGVEVHPAADQPVDVPDGKGQ